MYDDFKAEKRMKNPHGLQPLGDGVLVFDEVKVVLHLLYTSLGSEEEPKQASYMLQFLWRDLTSEYDIVGPY